MATITATSTKSGLWSDSTVWDIAAVPNNGGGNTYQVIIAPGHVVQVDGSYTIGTSVYTAGTYALQIQGTGASGTADTGATTYLTDSILTQAADYWNGAIVRIIDGTNKGQQRVISDFDNVTDKLIWVDAMPEACDTTTVYEVCFPGVLVWLNDVASASASWTLTIAGNLNIKDSGRMFIGTDPDNQPLEVSSSISAGRIPATRTATVYFNAGTPAAGNYHQISYSESSSVDRAQRIHLWGAMDYWSGTSRNNAAPTASGTVDSAADRVSFVDAALTQAADYWNGAMLEITGGTNYGEIREITDFDNATDRVYWSSLEPMPVPCDTTTTYTITHNYQRAKLASNVSHVDATAVTVTLDRPADWQAGDVVCIGGGLTASTPPEKVAITDRTDASNFTIVLAYDHKAGDFAYSQARNVIFEAVVQAGNDDQGFAFIATDPSLKMDFVADGVFFKNCGATASSSIGTISYTMTGAKLPIVRNSVFEGWRYNNTGPAAGYIYLSSIIRVHEDKPFQNIHGWSGVGLIDAIFVGAKVTDLRYNTWENLTFLNSTSTAGITVTCVGDLGIHPKIVGLWSDRANVNGPGTGTGYHLTGQASLYSSILRKAGAGALNWDYVTIDSLGGGAVLELKNVDIYHTSTGYGFQITDLDIGRISLENVRFNDIDDAAIIFGTSTGYNNNISVYMTNCRFDLCNSSGGAAQGAIIIPTGVGCRIYDTGSEYGTTTANKEFNIIALEGVNNSGNGGYIGVGCKYVTPTSSGSMTVPFGFQTNGSANDQIGALKGESSYEFQNPTIDASPADSFGFVGGAGKVTITTTPDYLPVASNIAMKMEPLTNIGRTWFNRRMPILVNCTSGTAYTISVYFQTNTTQSAGDRPVLWVYGGGTSIMKETDGTIDAWTQVSITFTPTYSGIVACYLGCKNTLSSPATNADGTPSSRGTVVVYADGFDCVEA